MKHFLLLLTLLCCLGTYGQGKKSVTFDFSKPSKLNPSYPDKAFNTEAGTSVKVSDVTFKSGDVSLSFTETGNCPGVWLAKEDNGYWFEPKVNSTVIFSVPSGAKIESIVVDKNSAQGGFSPERNQGGKFDFASPEKYCCKWYANGGTYTSVKFFITGEGTEINKITVTYTPRADVLTPVSTSIANGATVGSFSSIDLTFSSTITLNSGVNAELLADDAEPQTLTASVSGSKLTLSIANAITENGQYAISVPEGMVKTSSGYTNTALSYAFTVKKDQATFNPESVSPAEGYQENMSLKDPIVITFPELIGKVSDEALPLCLEGKAKNGVTFTIGSDNKSIIGKFNVEQPMTTPGTYTLTIPEGFVHNALWNIEGSDAWNKAVTYTWVVSNKKPDTETMKAAKELLLMTGVGYPSATSKSREALENAVEAEEVPTDEQLTTLMSAFYSETDVELPSTDKYYKICGINDKGDKLYLSYDGAAVSLTSNASSAYPFKAEKKGENKVAFSTLDGKYLHLLTTDNKYTGSSSKNVTEAYDASINDLTLARFSIDEVEDAKTMGKFSIHGSLGTDPVTSEAVSAFNLLDFSKKMILTDQSYKTLMFNDKISNAFVFEESEKPALESADIDVQLDKTVISSTDETIRLTFTHDDGVTLKAGVAPTITDANGNVVSGATATIAPVDNSTMDFDISFSGLSDGDYFLIIPKGAFSFAQDGKQVTSNEYKTSFKVSSKEDPTPTPGPLPSGFKHYQSWSKLPKENQDEYPADYLTQFIVYIDRAQSKNGLVGNPNVKVQLKENWKNELVGEGHFEEDPEHTDNINYAVKLVWDSPIDMVKVRTTQYIFIIPEGAFGDGNYGKYLQNASSVSPSQCTVNDSYTRCYDINTAIPSSINGVQAEDNAAKVIYDLQGRRVERVTKTGIYIVNGKKTVIWK